MSSDSAAVTPSSRLRLAVPVVSHVQIDAGECTALLSEAQGQLSGKFGPTTVLDVRGEDFTGGHIRGAVHSAFDQLEGQYDSLVAQAVAAKTSKLIVLDLTRQQAPLVAESFLSRFKDSQQGDVEEPVVYVVTSGFAGVLQEYVHIFPDRSKIELNDSGKKIVADFDAAAWTAIAVPRTPSRQDLPSSSIMLVYKSQADSAQAFGNTPMA